MILILLISVWCAHYTSSWPRISILWPQFSILWPWSSISCTHSYSYTVATIIIFFIVSCLGLRSLVGGLLHFFLLLPSVIHKGEYLIGFIIIWFFPCKSFHNESIVDSDYVYMPDPSTSRHRGRPRGQGQSQDGRRERGQPAVSEEVEAEPEDMSNIIQLLCVEDLWPLLWSK